MKLLPQDPSAWARLSPYLDEALDLEPHERDAWLSKLAITDPDIAESVRELLRKQAVLDSVGFMRGSPLTATRFGTFMPVLEQIMRERVGIESGDWLRGDRDSPPAETAAIAAGGVLGPYRLIREIGHGGMSSVWLAERCDGLLKREVALKLPYTGPRRAQIAERFERERDILATLTHPNIARLYDAGISASGQAWLAMEYVNGTTLTQFCDSARLSVRERLEIFLQVLAAVEFAHTHLVLHRDLKPSNILVTGQGRVVLLDFGVAKILTPEADATAPLTEMMARILTPDYASPEQISGQSLSTISDIYSLGVVLYELLCGARPFNVGTGPRRDLEEAVLNTEPPRLSQVALTEEVAEARHTTTHRLARTLKGDLETVVLKALRKDPADRYHSAGALAQDIGNYLENLPVSARPDSFGRRFGRFIARYRWQVTAATFALLAGFASAAMAARGMTNFICS